jgi:hypothetical protein
MPVMITFGFFHDAGLTTPVNSSNKIAGPGDVQLWFGSTGADLKARAQSNPGVDPIKIMVSDSNSGGGQPNTAVRLATSQSGLASATPGADLEIGAQVLSGVANAVPFWVRLTDLVGVTGSYADLSLIHTDIDEDPV